MIRLLDACTRKLAERGMQQMLIDAIRGGEEGFQSLGKTALNRASPGVAGITN
jgi:hypothetical protein